MEEKKLLENSDFRHGIHKEEDGIPIAEIISECKGEDKDVLLGDQKSTKMNLSEDDAFLKPIIIGGELKKRVLYLINKISEKKISRVRIHLWNKLSDPNVHPNDYLKFEEPSEFKFEYVLTTCRGVYLLNTLNTNPVIDQESIEAAHQEIIEEATNNRSEEVENELEDLTSQFKIPELPEESENMFVDEILPHESLDEDFSEMKIHEVFALFKSVCCKKIRDGVCDKRHYLIGKGDIVINDVTYSGLHIYLYPDKHYDQVDIPEENIKDDTYFRFKRDKDTPGIEYSRPEYVGIYIKEFRSLLELL